MEKAFVEIIIPVYNGEQHLSECLESIFKQTYDRWNAVVVNNCSSDRTGQIAEQFAKRDKRLKVLHFREFMGQADNYNRALAQTSNMADYIKIVEADNTISEDALTLMVGLAEKFPEVGIVGCCSLKGREILGAGLDFDKNILFGRDVWRLLFEKNIYILGTPTSLLFRNEAIKDVKPWFRAGLFYDDVDICIRILRKWKFGFVHQILSFIRDDNNGIFSKYREYDFIDAYLYFLSIDYGADFLDMISAKKLVKQCENAYFGKLAHAVFSMRGKEYWKFHKNAFKVRGQELNKRQMLSHVAIKFVKLFLNPMSTIERIIIKLKK